MAAKHRTLSRREQTGNEEKGLLRGKMYDPTKPFNEQTRTIISSTHSLQGPLIVRPHGKRFQLEPDFDYWKGFKFETCTDGIGTKGYLHWQMNTIANGVKDAFAMVVDDLIEGGYVPFVMADHIIMQNEDQGKLDVAIKSLKELTLKYPYKTEDGRRWPISIGGGETAFMDTLKGFEMAIFAIGAVRRGHEIMASVKEGDVLIGLQSSGVHSNGLTFLRLELGDTKRDLDRMLPWGVTLGAELTKPTSIYLPAITELIESLTGGEGRRANLYIHGMVHITGGGLTKLKELITGREDLDVIVSRDHALTPHEIFAHVYGLGTQSKKMYEMFNNGVGYVVAIEHSHVREALDTLRKHFPAEIIGRIEKGEGNVVIESQYEPITHTYAKR